MAAKKKPLETKTLAELVPGAALTTNYLGFERPAERKAGIKVKDVQELVNKLANDAKVL
jgi:electron transfer flavoprotein beta subunit